MGMRVPGQDFGDGDVKNVSDPVTVSQIRKYRAY
jgi:hypothetical protein